MNYHTYIAPNKEWLTKVVSFTASFETKKEAIDFCVSHNKHHATQCRFIPGKKYATIRFTKAS